MSNKVKKVLYGGAVAVALIVPILSMAAVLPEPSNPITPGGTPLNLAEIERLIGRIAQFLIVAGVILAVIYIIWGGIAWMMAGGSDEKSKVAKQRIWNGVFGAAIVLAVGVILQTLAGLITRSFFS